MLFEEILALDLRTLRDHSSGEARALNASEHRDALHSVWDKTTTVSVRRAGALAAYGAVWEQRTGVWFVSGIAINPDQRMISVRRELRRKMLELIENAEIKTLVSNVYKNNTASMALHQHLGFLITRENEIGVEFTLQTETLRRSTRH